MRTLWFVPLLALIAVPAHALVLTHARGQNVVPGYLASMCEVPQPIKALECKQDLVRLEQDWAGVQPELKFISVVSGSGSATAQKYLRESYARVDAFYRKVDRWLQRYASLPSRPNQRD